MSKDTANTEARWSVEYSVVEDKWFVYRPEWGSGRYLGPDGQIYTAPFYYDGVRAAEEAAEKFQPLRENSEIESATDRFIDKVFDCLTGDKGQMHIKETAFHKDGLEFCSIQMCPDIAEAHVTVDVSEVIDIFDDLKSCQITNMVKGQSGIIKTPHLRMTGMFHDILILFDFHLQPIDLDPC